MTGEDSKTLDVQAVGCECGATSWISTKPFAIIDTSRKELLKNQRLASERERESLFVKMQTYS